MQLNMLTEGDFISATKLADALLTTKKEIGQTIGIPPESLSRQARLKSPTTQTALRRLIEILNAIQPFAGNQIMAYAWFRSEPIPGFGGRTPDQILRDGEGEALRAHIQRRMAGGYA